LAGQTPESREAELLTPAQARLRKMVLDSVASPHSRRNYAKGLDDLFQFCAMESLSPSAINVRLSAVRKMVGEARRAGMIGQEEAASHRHPQYPAEGNPAGKLADPGASEGTARRS
jgi:hypothetical protein